MAQPLSQIELKLTLKRCGFVQYAASMSQVWPKPDISAPLVVKTGLPINYLLFSVVFFHFSHFEVQPVTY